MSDKVTIDRETLERVLDCLMMEGCDLRAAEVRAALRAEQPVAAEPVAWSDKAMELATDFGVESLRLGSSERQDIFLDGGKASWKTVALREKREAARERLRKYLYTAAGDKP